MGETVVGRVVGRTFEEGAAVRSLLASLIAFVGSGAAGGEKPGGGIAYIEWSLGPNLPKFRKGGCAAAVREKIYLMGGTHFFLRPGPVGPQAA